MENSLSGPAVSGVVVTRSLDPLGATRPHIELYVRWLQEAPIPTLDGLASHVGGRGLLPDLCDRRRALAFASRVRPAAQPARRVPDVGPDRPPVRGAVNQRQALDQPLRLRTRHHARPAGATHLRGHRQQHRGPWRGARPPGPAGSRQGATRSCSSPSHPPWAAPSNEPSTCGAAPVRSC
jgi:hypothetical protein